MSATSRSPSSTGFLQPTKFELVFARLPSTTYFCQTVNIPGVTLGEVVTPTPFADLYSPGEKLVYETLSIDFLIDEEMKGWREIHDWMRGAGKPTTFDEYKNLSSISKAGIVATKPQFSDATLMVHSALNNTKLRFDFVDCFPTSLSSINFDTKENADSIITSTVTIRYTYFNISKVS